MAAPADTEHMGRTLAVALRTLAFALGGICIIAGAVEVAEWSIALPASLPPLFLADIIGRRLRARASGRAIAEANVPPVTVPYRFIVPQRHRDDVDRAA